MGSKEIRGIEKSRQGCEERSNHEERSNQSKETLRKKVTILYQAKIEFDVLIYENHLTNMGIYIIYSANADENAALNIAERFGDDELNKSSPTTKRLMVFFP